MDLKALTIKKARQALDAGEFSAFELTHAYLKNIEEKNSDVNAYLEVFNDAEEQAKKADEMIQGGHAKQLTGIPIAIKDNILVEGKTASAASRILEHYTASYDATVIAKLKAEGVVLLGRTNMDEFAMGGSTEHSAFGPTKNPHDLARVPGGSSGGSAAAVASNMALAALGSDTGGSIRQPAALCGVVGLKSTYGTVSRSGLIAMGSSLDQIGPFAKTVHDAEMLWSAISGHDPKDGTSLADDFFKKETPRKPKVLGVPRSFLQKGVDEDVLAAFNATLDALGERGYEVKDVSLPRLEHALPVYYIIMPAEASTNLARFDGVRYGLSVEGDDIHDMYRKTRGKGFGEEVRRRILLGTFVLSSGYVDAYYRKARAVRATIRNDIEKVLKDVDVMVMPTTPTPAFKIGEKNEPLAMYAADIFTTSSNLTGSPAISVPMDTVAREGKQLPIGFQVIASHGDEEALFTIGKDVETA